MSSPKREDSTESLILQGEALRSPASGRERRSPGTRQLVRDAERLIGREPQAAGAKSLLRWVVVLSVVAIVLAGLFFLLA